MIPERYDRTKICHQSYVTSKMCIFFEASWQMTRWWWSLTNSEAFGPAAACRCRVWVGFVLVAMGCPVASYQRWSQHTKGSKFWIVLGGSKPLVGQMWEIFGNLGNLSPLELHRRITDSVETVCWVVRRFERPRPRLISVAWSQWQPGKPGKPGSPHEFRRICMNFPKFPVVFPQQGVTERLPSIGDRVHHACETIGTVEGFDEDGNWSKFIRFRQRLKCCMSEISIIVNSQGAYLFLGYLALNVTCSFTDPVNVATIQSQLLKVTSKWRCPMVRLPYG